MILGWRRIVYASVPKIPLSISKKIQLLPQELLWGETNRKPTNYLEGKVQTVEIQGIHFRREEALNYLSRP